MSDRVNIFCSSDESEVEQEMEENRDDYDTVSIGYHEGSACMIAQDGKEGGGSY